MAGQQLIIKAVGRGLQQQAPGLAAGLRDNASPVEERMRFLAREMQRHRDLYYDDASQPEITDAEFDAIEQELLGLESAHPGLRDPDSPTGKVGDAKSSTLFPKVTHRTPMLSLDKVHTTDELQRFLGRYEGEKLALWPKFDGCSLSLTYEKGALVRAVTRGDGTQGDDITANVTSVTGVEQQLTDPINCEIRGEVVMHRSDWEAYNAANPEKKFANPRNAVSGSLRLKDPALVAKRPMHFYAFDLILHEGDVNAPTAARLTELLGASVVRYAEADNAQEVLDYVEQTDADRTGLDYEIDGVVIRLADREAFENAGFTGSHPRGAMAFKLAAEVGETTLREVTWQVGKSGTVAPVAEITPLFLAGTTISRATLHNLAEIARRDIRVGDRIRLQRAGDVIPQVIGPVDPSARTGNEREIVAPAGCPSCGGELVETGNSRVLMCANKDACPAQQQRRMAHWVSRKAGDVDAVGASILDKLTDVGLIEKPSDLYTLTYEQLMPDDEPAFEGLGQRSAARIIESVEKSKDMGLRRAIIGWSIPLASEGTAKRLCRAGYESIEQVAAATPDELAQIEDIGTKVAESLHEFLNTPEMQAEIARLRANGVSLDVREEDKPITATDSSSAFAGKTVVITGTLEGIGRKEFQSRVEQAGGKASGSISVKTDYLIAGENAGSKLTKAQSLGVAVLTQAQAEAMLD
jgi:DNA ligase (NAD+)